MVASKSDIGENPPELVCRTRHLVLADDQTVFLDTRFRWMCSRGGPDEIRKLVRSRLVE